MSRADGLLRGRQVLTPLVAALLTGLLWSLASMLEDRPPWGGHDRVLGDLGNQSIPFLAYYRDVLTGHADGNLQFAWGMGYGQSFGPTFTMYLSNPLNVVVLLFPRLAIPTAIATVTILTAMVGAATMTLLLQRLRPGTPVLAIALAAAYGTSQYAVNDASYQPMWLVGGAALPLMVYSAIWVRERRRVAWLTPLLFFVCWYSNFYTSWMATLASGLIVCAMIVAKPSDWPRPWLTLARWASLAVLGIVMDAFALVPTYIAVKHSAMTKDVPFVPGAWGDWAGRLLVGTEGLGWAPSLGIGVLLGSVLATCILLTIRDRRTLTWVGLLVVVALSLRWHATAIVWHGFDSPDGNFFREAFVLIAMQVILVWQLLPALAARGWKRSGVTAIVVAIGYAAVVVMTRGSHVVTGRTAVVSMVLAGLAVLVITALARGRRIGMLAVAALVVLLAGEVVVNHVAIMHRRETRLAGQMVNLDGLSAKADVVARIRNARADGARIGVTTRTTTNDPMLFGGASGTSYTTMMPKTLSDLLVNAGMTTGAGGRRLTGSSNLLEDTAFGVSQRVTWHAGRTSTVQHLGVTLARWVPSALVQTSTATDGDPLALYSALLQLPRRQPDIQHGPGTLFPTARFSVGCPSGAGLLVVDATTSRVTARVAGQAAQSSADPWTGHLLVVPLSPTTRAQVDVTRPTTGTAIPSMACTTTRPAQLGQPASIQHDATSFSVQVPAAQAHDTLLLATAATDEWSCQQGGSSSPISTHSFHRLLTVAPVAAGVLTCRFTPRAFTSGVLVSLVALLAWLAILSVAWRRSSARPRWRRPRASTLLRS